MATTFRSDVRAGMYGLASGFATASPSFTLAAYRYRPASFGNRPLVFVGPISETIIHTQGTRQRTMTPSLVFVWASSAAPEDLADDRDVVIDAFLDYATARPHAVSDTTVTSPTGVEDVELELDGAFYPASIVSFGETLALEGRS